ncbi:C1 family peptidase [Amycolatopsis cihanbeyliensis]|uniref:Papain like protease n=1 Tax=Amycolatopsis cihanbeyliensis TaxID=1128664 RepID=A0A542DKW9_AMYCI|nr:C1 family peptidase [Amycolatopsis cihanbeyliensis]TQJ03674.1 papain like protease [Amycolatopsis cihanbeyliensis]
MSPDRSHAAEIAAVRAGLAALADPWLAGETLMSRLPAESRVARLGVPAPSSDEVTARADQAQRMAEAARRTVGEEVVAALAPTPNLPERFDLRNLSGRDYVTPVKDQGESGSCSAFGTVAALEGTAAYTRSAPGLNLDLSEAHLFFGHGAERGRTNQTGSWPDELFDDSMSKGVTFEDYFPYTEDGSGSLHPDWGNRVAKVEDVVDLGRNPAAIKHHIYGYGPVTACLVVYNDLFHYTGGVYRHTTEETSGGHCVALVGWDDTAGCWIAKNSWGADWGERGYFRIAYGEAYIEDYPDPRPTTLGCTGVNLRAWLPPQRALRLFATAHDANGWAYLENLGWTRLSGGSHSTTNKLAMLTHARAGGFPVAPFVDNDELSMVQIAY